MEALGPAERLTRGRLDERQKRPRPVGGRRRVWGYCCHSTAHHRPCRGFRDCLTLFTEFFASFDHSTCALSVPGLYASLRRIHVALRTAVPSHSTPGCGHATPTRWTGAHVAQRTGQSPSIVVRSRTLPGAPVHRVGVACPHPGVEWLGTAVRSATCIRRKEAYRPGTDSAQVE